MPFIRYTRDKRGYESTFVMHAYRGTNGASRTRVLYFFRLPSGSKVGRRALENEVMEALEHTHPDLTFDWQSLLREPTLPRMEPRERPHQRQRSGPRPDQQRPRPPAPEPVQIVIEDESLLGKTIGARDAARLRQRYNELQQRILRRARTPEERDRLTDRLHRLNPDEWTEPAAILAAVPTIDTDLDAIASELPHRRRGRRGGRHRSEGEVPSGIISRDSARGEQNNDDGWQELEPGPAGQSVHDPGPGDDGRPGADAEPAEQADTAGLAGHDGVQTPPARPAQQTGQVFRAGTDVIPIDVYPRDAKGQFVPDLTKADFQVFEDGVEQTVLNFTRANGGAFYNDLASTAPERRSEGLILPKTAPPPDTAGRLFIVFIDDLHFMAQQTPEVRRMLQLIRDTLVHDTDLIGFVSSGFSSIEMDPAYDYQHRRFNEVINKVMGSGPSIEEMIRMQAGVDGLAELNHNISVAFGAAKSLLTQLEDLHGKRKAFIWVSNGYSLDPFKDSRLKKEFEKYANSGMCDAKQTDDQSEPDRRDPCTYANAEMTDIQNIRNTGNDYGFDIFNRPTMQWKVGDLMFELGELIRVANRANTMFFTMDPRGLIAGLNGASMQSALSHPEETDFIMSTTGTMRALAENTGGLACVGTNDCRPFLQQIDNMTSDYYMLGYRSSNPDPFKLARKIEIKVKRPGVRLEAGRDYRGMYYLKKQPKNSGKN